MCETRFETCKCGDERPEYDELCGCLQSALDEAKDRKGDDVRLNDLFACESCKKLREALGIALQYLPTDGEDGYGDDVHKEVVEVHRLIREAC